MSRRWRVAVLGLGHWYSAFGLARALVEYEPAELVAVAEPDAWRREQFSGTFGIEGYSDARRVLERPDIDIVHIASPVSAIPALTIQAAQAGKHIVMGKPMAMTLAEADAMVDAVEAAGVCCVPFQGLMRLRAGDLKARIDRGDIGALAVLHQTGRWAIAEDWSRSGRPGWFADPAHVPGGAFIDEGIYWIDLFRWLTGSDVVEVEARMANLVHRDLAVEDWGMATFTFESGVIGTIEASWTIGVPRVTGPSPKHNSVVRLEVIGTKGEIIDQWFRDPGLAVLAAGSPGWTFERTTGDFIGPPSPFPLDYLIDCLDAGRAPATTIRDARASFAVALAAYRAAREGRRISGRW